MTKQSLYDASSFDQRPVVLIVGKIDFLGSYLAEFLLLKNCRVIMADIFSAGKSSETKLAKQKKKILEKCLRHPQFTFIKEKWTAVESKIERLDYLFFLQKTPAYRNQLYGRKQEIDFADFLKLVSRTGAKLLVAGPVEDRKFFEDWLARGQTKEKVDWRLVAFKFVYGPRMDLETPDEMTTLIKAAVNGESLRVPGGGSQRVYPTFVADVIYGLSKAMFSPGTKGKTFFLINPEGMTLLSLAQWLKEESPLSLSIEFVPEKRPEVLPFSIPEVLKSQRELGWQAKVGIKEGLRQTLAFFGPPKKRSKKLREKPLKKIKRRKRRPVKEIFSGFFSRSTVMVATAALLFFLVLTSPFLSLAANTAWGVFNLKRAQSALTTGDWQQLIVSGRQAQKALSRAEKTSRRLTPLLATLNLESQTEQLESLLKAGNGLAKVVVHGGLAAQSAADLGGIVFQSQTGEIGPVLEKLKVELDFVYYQLSLVETEMKGKETFLPLEISFSEIRHFLQEMRKGIPILPEIIGLNGKRVYLVLLQNNMELRPTGGFIGSYALLTFDEGHLIDFEVEDVYTADGQLKGHVEPPAALKQTLGEAGWYLRDSNWHPDFPTSALRAEWFLEKEIGRTVDGVIGVDLFLAQNLLRQIGAVEVFDFQEKIDHQNLFERAEYYSEAGFFPGSTQKKDFLASLTRALFKKIQFGGAETWLALAKALYQSLREKDLLIYFHHPEAMAVISSLGGDGSIRGVQCSWAPDSNFDCLVDYLMIVEANVGVNKANYFVRRTLNHQVRVDQTGTVTASLQIQYQNQSQSEVFPGGRYKNYLRLLVPRGSELKEVLIDGQKLPEEKITAEELADKKSFGFLIEVPIKTQKTVKVVYQLEPKINWQKPTRYLLLVQKQPGIKDQAFDFWLTVPKEVSFLDPQPPAVKSFNTLVFKPPFNQDLIFEVGLVK